MRRLRRGLIRWETIALAGLLLLWGCVSPAALGTREQTAPVPDPAPTVPVTRGDVVILDGSELVPGVTVRVHGRIGVFGNEPFTYPAIRTRVVPAAASDEGNATGEGNAPEPQPWLLELTGLEAAEVDRVLGRPVVVTGTLTALPRGPSPGRLEVSEVTDAP